MKPPENKLCPYRPGTWSYRFWVEGFEASASEENPYERGTFPWEIWNDGKREGELEE